MMNYGQEKIINKFVILTFILYLWPKRTPTISSPKSYISVVDLLISFVFAAEQIDQLIKDISLYVSKIKQ